MNTPLFTGDVFQCNADRTYWMIQTHSDEVNLGRRRTFHELNSLNLARLMKSLTFGLGLRLLKEDPNETLFKIFLAFFYSFFPFLPFYKKRKKSIILSRSYKFLVQIAANHCHEMQPQCVHKIILEEMLPLLTIRAAKQDLKKSPGRSFLRLLKPKYPRKNKLH